MRHLVEARMKVGSFLKSTRETAGLSTEDVATHLQLESVYIMKIEAGLESLSLAEIYAFANLYDVAPSEVMQLLLELPSERAIHNARLLEASSYSH